MKPISPEPSSSFKNSTPLEKSSQISPFYLDLLSNVAAGVCISYTMFPLESVKKYFQQQDRSISLKPYRGSLIFAANIVPATTIHLTLNEFFTHYLSDTSPFYLHLSASILCGVAGAPTATIVENTITRQQMLKSGPIYALRDMARHSLSRPFKSFGQIATRDGVFTGWMFAINPWFIKYSQANLCDETSTANYRESIELMAKFFAAFIGAGVTHPFDTIGTWRQRSHIHTNMYQAAKELYKGASLYLPSPEQPLSTINYGSGHGVILNNQEFSFVKDGQIHILPKTQERLTISFPLYQHQIDFIKGKREANITKIDAVNEPIARDIMKAACENLSYDPQHRHANPISVSTLAFIYRETGGWKRLYAGFPWRFLLFLAFTNLIPRVRKSADSYLSRNYDYSNNTFTFFNVGKNEGIKNTKNEEELKKEKIEGIINNF